MFSLRFIKMRYGWSLDIKCWNALLFILGGLQWNTVKLRRSSDRSIPRISGVYMLCSIPPLDYDNGVAGFKSLNIYNPIYIGESNNLKKRFLDYCSRTNLSSNKVSTFLHDYQGKNISFVYAPCGTDTRKKYQNILIHCFGPSANGQVEEMAKTLSGIFAAKRPA